MEITVKRKFKILGNFVGEPQVENFTFTHVNTNNIKIKIDVMFKTKTIETTCQREISDELYNFFKSGEYKSIQICDEEGNIQQNADGQIFEKLNAEINALDPGFFDVTNRIIHLIKIWLWHNDIEGIECDDFIFLGKDDEWTKIGFQQFITAIDRVIYSNLDETNLNLIQNCLDNNIEPFIALDFLSKAHNEEELRHSWIYSTIAAELAIKEFLIAKHPNLEVLLDELPSPPLDKLYGKILKEYEGIEPYIKIKDIQTGIKIRNYMIHRAQVNLPISNQNLYIYRRLIEATIYQLLQKLYPQLNPIIIDHYPPKMGYTELEPISKF